MHPVNFACIRKMQKYICLAHAHTTCEFAIAMCPVTSYLLDLFWDFSRPFHKTDDTQAYFVDQWHWMPSFNLENGLKPIKLYQSSVTLSTLNSDTVYPSQYIIKQSITSNHFKVWKFRKCLSATNWSHSASYALHQWSGHDGLHFITNCRPWKLVFDSVQNLNKVP